MATRFVDNGASATEDPYDTWDKAALTLAIAIIGASTNLSAGEDVHMAADHTETPTSPTYTFPGTASQPNRVISVTQGTTTYNNADNIQIDVTGTGDMIIQGFVKFYGVSLKTGDDLITTATPSSLSFDDSIIEIDRTSGIWSMGNSSGQNKVTLKNTTVNFSGGGVGNIFTMINGIFEWNGGILSHSGDQPTAIFDTNSRINHISVAGVDLSSITTALVDVSDSTDIIANFHHCLINSTFDLTTGTIATVDTQVLMSGCDDTTGNELFRFEYVTYYGSIFHDKGIFRTDGAKDPDGNNISWKMVTTANATEFSEPLISPPIVKNIKTTGSKTFTVHVNWDNATDLEDDEMWLEIEYLEASADTDSAFSSANTGTANDGLDNILAAPASQATSTEGWTGTSGFTNEQKRKLEVTVTINRVGPVIGRVHMGGRGGSAITIYIDPKIEVA